MKNTFLVITSISNDKHPILQKISQEAKINDVPFLLIGDSKSPTDFNLDGCDFYSLERQQNLSFALASLLPIKHYSRKNIGYLIAKSKGAEIVIETDDDNIPYSDFWESRNKNIIAHLIQDTGWCNVYQYFTKKHIWPRGFSLSHIKEEQAVPGNLTLKECPIQQGLADENPDVDAIYRLTLPLPVCFEESSPIALGKGSICPFNSQNTTWFKEAFLLMYLPSYCSFRMTDIWRSFVAQRIAWTCDWPILFHKSTVMQERNDHNLMKDFLDEQVGYEYNEAIMENLMHLSLKNGPSHIAENMLSCYKQLIQMGCIGEEELILLKAWLKDMDAIK